MKKFKVIADHTKHKLPIGTEVVHPDWEKDKDVFYTAAGVDRRYWMNPPDDEEPDVEEIIEDNNPPPNTFKNKNGLYTSGDGRSPRGVF